MHRDIIHLIVMSNISRLTKLLNETWEVILKSISSISFAFSHDILPAGKRQLQAMPIRNLKFS